MTKRFLECVTLTTGEQIGECRYYLDGVRVSHQEYSIAWLVEHKAGRLGLPVTQSTGFGYRIKTESSHG